MNTTADAMMTFSKTAWKPRAFFLPNNVSAPPSMAPIPEVLAGVSKMLAMSAKLEMTIKTIITVIHVLVVMGCFTSSVFSYMGYYDTKHFGFQGEKGR